MHRYNFSAGFTYIKLFRTARGPEKASVKEEPGLCQQTPDNVCFLAAPQHSQWEAVGTATLRTVVLAAAMLHCSQPTGWGMRGLVPSNPPQSVPGNVAQVENLGFSVLMSR